VVIYPTIIQMIPFIAHSQEAIALLALLQIGIWISYMLFAYRLFKGDIGGAEL
jgi:hypothetical protein